MKYIIVSKRQILLGLCAFLALAIAVIGSVKVFAREERLLPIYCVECEEKKIAISFDAAWGNDDTEELIKILAEYDVPATFFVVGAWVDKYPESVKQLHDAGHKIGNHSNSHPYMTKLSEKQMLAELTACNTKIANVTGEEPVLFRAPYGDYNNATIKAVESVGMYTIQWDVDSLDWKENATAESIAQRVISKAKNGSIVLFHNDAEYTPDALPTILKALKDQGYEFVFIEDLIIKENYEIKHDGTQCKKDGE
ncbi:MAG: polysaccharide deacetylase family protein [Clostridia bacterium]|nr:polysaccharide deacetylase family protein [Clostridia bacterium]